MRILIKPPPISTISSVGSDSLSLWEKVLEINWVMVLLVALLAGLGTAFLWGAAGGDWQPWAKPHLWRSAVGIISIPIVALLGIRLWWHGAYGFYFLVMAALVATSLFGTETFGAKRWLVVGGFSLQASEFAKIALVLAIARFYSQIPDDQISSPFNFIKALAIALPVFVLVVRQPDLGTALLLMVIPILLSFLAGTRMVIFWFGAILLAVSSPFLWQNFLKDYQKQRIITFLNPESNPLSHGYQVIQSKIALGSGGLYGKGFLEGTQSHLRFLPENRTDFIFTMFAEETGFIGAILLLFVYGFLVLLGMTFALHARCLFARLLAQGFASLLFLYVFVNVGMVAGILPVVGMPLPVFSYGGSSLLSFMLAFGILAAVWLDRRTKVGIRS